MKFKKGLVKLIHQEDRLKKKKERFRKKHRLPENKEIIIEKTGAFQIFSVIVKSAARLILILISAVGVLSFLHPVLRSDLYQIIIKALKEIGQPFF